MADKKFITKNGLLTNNTQFVDEIGNSTQSITLTMDSLGTLSFDGTNGQLFSVTDNMTGTIFSVNDISGIPSIEVDDTGDIRLAEFDGDIDVGNTSALVAEFSTSKMRIGGGLATDDLAVQGDGVITGALQVNGNIVTLGTVDGIDIAGINVALTGDVSGSATVIADGSIDISTNIQPNSVALGTDTTGNYVQQGTTSGNGISGSVNTEAGTFTVTSNATNANTPSTIVYRDASGNFSAGTITADLSGNATTATTASNAQLLDNIDSTGFARLGLTTQPDNYLYLDRASTSPVQYVRQGSTGDIARFFTSATASATSGTSQVTITNTGGITTTGDVIVGGDLTINGTTTTINATTVTVDDKNIELGSVASPSDATADGGGITLLGTTNKTIIWDNATDAWKFNQNVDVAGNITLTGTVDGVDVSTIPSTYAPLASPALTGNPTAPTATTGDNDTTIATTAFVQQEITANAYTLPSSVVHDNENSTFTGTQTFDKVVITSNDDGNASGGSLWLSGTSNALVFDTDGGRATKRITTNDGGGNFNIWAGGYYNGGELYTTTSDGATKITSTIEGSNGVLEFEVANTGTADATISWANRLTLDNSGLDLLSGTISATTFSGALSGNASTATTLQTARTINGTSFNGSANITTATWGTSRTLTIGNTGKSVNGSANVSWSLAEIGAQPAGSYDNYVSWTIKGDGATTYPITSGDTLNIIGGTDIDVTATADDTLTVSFTGTTGDINQNAFSNIAVSGQTTVAADTTTDTLTLVAGTYTSITTNATTDEITINSTGTDLGFTNGTTAGPTITSSTGSNVVIPSASLSVSGVVTTGGQSFSGTKNITLGSSSVGVTASTGTNTTALATTAFVQQELGTLTAADISTSTTNFNTNLSAADDTVQKALDTLDELVASGAITRSKWNFVATSGQTVFSITYDNVNTVDVYIDGVLAKYNLDYSLSGGNTLTLLEPAVLGTLVDVYAWNSADLVQMPTAIKTEIIATEGQTTFAATYNTSAVDVYSNGVLLLSSDYTASNGTSIVLDEAASAGDVIRINSNDAQPQDPMVYPTATDLTATSDGQTAFTVTYNPSQVYVYVDGIKLKASEFTASNGTSITLASGVDIGTWVHVISNSNSPGIGVNWGMVNGTPDTLEGYGVTDEVMKTVMDLPSTGTNLDSYMLTGIYKQNTDAGATAGSNYPADVSGVLVVINDGTKIYQSYTKTASPYTEWKRTKINSTWGEWVGELVYSLSGTTLTISAP